jgi:N-acetylglutamate synthase-like GNAT family acetyltransferase
VVGAARLRRSVTLGLLEGPVVTDGWRHRLVGTRLALAACIEARDAGLARVVGVAAGGSLLGRLGFAPAPGGDHALVRDL